jgi:hypothetical protein
MCYTNKRWFIARGIGFGILFIGFFSLIVLLLWNWLMPAIFGLTTISYLQALGLLIFSKILFFGFHRGYGHPGHFRSREYWKKRFEEESKSVDEKLGERTT